MFDLNRQNIRLIFFEAWQKMQSGITLLEQEKNIADVIEMHPEYYSFFENKNHAFEDLEGHNPFAHMGMHITLKEQIQLDKPKGIQLIYQKLQKRFDLHQAEHEIFPILLTHLRKFMFEGKPFSEDDYLHDLNKNLVAVYE